MKTMLPIQSVLKMLKDRGERDPATPIPFEWDEISSRVAASRYELETQLIGSILVDPLEGLRLAMGEKLQPWIIEDEALRIIYCAALVFLDNDRLTGSAEDDGLAVVLLARDGLKRARLWCESSSLPMFNADSLAALLCSFPYISPAWTPRFAARLVEMDWRLLECKNALAKSRVILEEIVSYMH